MPERRRHGQKDDFDGIVHRTARPVQVCSGPEALLSSPTISLSLSLSLSYGFAWDPALSATVQHFGHSTAGCARCAAVAGTIATSRSPTKRGENAAVAAQLGVAQGCFFRCELSLTNKAFPGQKGGQRVEGSHLRLRLGGACSSPSSGEEGCRAAVAQFSTVMDSSGASA